MDTKMTFESISALSDGELQDSRVDAVMAQLQQADARLTWDAYQQIGDVLRSEDMATAMSPGFNARLFARLDAEPTVIAPALVGDAGRAAGWQRGCDDIVVEGGAAMIGGNGLAGAVRASPGRLRRYGVPGMAAAAVAALVFVSTPQLMVALTHSPASIVSLVSPGNFSRASAQGTLIASADGKVAAATEGGDVMRDPGLDEYLLAHQRFSPSVYSTAQFARSSTFANESGR
jgi:sigma-E factor negative regulatory protein RseA